MPYAASKIEIPLRKVKAVEPAVAALISTHFELMRATSPEESCHVMPADALDREGALILTVEDGEAVLGIGALKEIGPGHGEIKSMHTAAAARGKGVARRVLLGLIEAARDQGMTRLSLETGTQEPFAPARALYHAHGFEVCPPFGSYVEDPLSVFMTREIRTTD